MTTYSRIRVDQDQVDLLSEVLTEARSTRIERKIALREKDPNDQELLAVRWELSEINRMMQEAKRAKDDIESAQVLDYPKDSRS